MNRNSCTRRLPRFARSWRHEMAVKTKRATAVKKVPADGVSADERKQLREMELLLRIARQVAGIDTLDELLTAIVEISAKETGADRGTLFLNDPQTGELYSRVAQV